jgi:hypothetical protein
MRSDTRLSPLPCPGAPRRRALHGDGLLEFQGRTPELSQLATIVLQLFVALAVGQVKVFEAGEFDFQFGDLPEGEMGVTRVGTRAASRK